MSFIYSMLGASVSAPSKAVKMGISLIWESDSDPGTNTRPSSSSPSRGLQASGESTRLELASWFAGRGEMVERSGETSDHRELGTGHDQGLAGPEHGRSDIASQNFPIIF